MADTGIGRMLAIPGRSAVSGTARSHQEVGRGLDRHRTLNSGRRTEKKTGADQSSFLLSLIVAIEQWICLVLGLVCVVSGILGISMNPSQNDLTARLAWTGLGYVPLLRMTAAMCMALGIVLVRLGWTGRWPPSAGRSHTQIAKEQPDEKRR
jgi:hypothetical protein